MNELEEAEVEGQLLLGNSTVWSQPGTQERPEPLYGIDMNFVFTISVFIPCELTLSVVHRLVVIAHSSNRE